MPPLLFALLYGGGYIAQFIRNYTVWKNAGGTPGYGTAPDAVFYPVGQF
jgi:type IV secretion system protein VirD4